MAPSTRIYLTGFMGCGKSTLGPILANVLGYDFADLAAAIEAETRRSVQAIFAEDGEAAFRSIEAEALRRTARRERLVVSLGGGALAREENLQFALAHGTVVYLRVPTAQLVQRLQKSPTERPLLQDEQGRPLSREALTEKIRTMLAAREPYYTRTHLTVDVGGRDVGQTVDAVVRALNRLHRQGRR